MKPHTRSYALCFIAAGVALHVTGCESLAQRGSTDFAEAPMSRARVAAELQEAQRLGLITVGEEDVPQITAEQLRLIAEAGERAGAASALASR